MTHIKHNTSIPSISSQVSETVITRFAIEMNIGGGWDQFPEDGVYDSRAEAEQAIKDHIADCINAVEGGDMNNSPDPTDFRVVEAV